MCQLHPHQKLGAKTWLWSRAWDKDSTSLFSHHALKDPAKSWFIAPWGAFSSGSIRSFARERERQVPPQVLLWAELSLGAIVLTTVGLWGCLKHLIQMLKLLKHLLPSCPLVRHELGNWLPLVTPESNVDLAVLLQRRLQLWHFVKRLQLSKCTSSQVLGQSSGNC